MAMVARSVLNASTCMLHSNSLFSTGSTNVRSSSRIECSLSSSSSNSVGSRVSCSATRALLSAIPFPEVVVGDEDDVEELTFLDNGYEEIPDENNPESNWLTPQYMSMRLRCSTLMRQEASDALSRHFNGRQPAGKPSKPAEELPSITLKPYQREHEKLELISQRYRETPVEFIKAVVIGDIQEGYFR